MKIIYLLLLLTVVAGFDLVRADVSVIVSAEDGINDSNTQSARGAVSYSTSAGISAATATNGAAISYGPDGQPGHQFRKRNSNLATQSRMQIAVKTLW